MSEKVREANRGGAAEVWTEVLAESWTPVSDTFLEVYAGLRDPLTTQEAMFVIQLLSFKRSSALPFPGLRGIADRMGVSYSSVRSYLEGLRQKNYVKRLLRRRDTSLYDLRPLFEELELQGSSIKLALAVRKQERACAANEAEGSLRASDSSPVEQLVIEDDLDVDMF